MMPDEQLPKTQLLDQWYAQGPNTHNACIGVYPGGSVDTTPSFRRGVVGIAGEGRGGR